MDEITVAGKRYISARRAAKMSGYAQDYIGQMCRSKSLPAKKVGRNWFVDEEALTKHLKQYKQKQWEEKKRYLRTAKRSDAVDDASYEPEEGPLYPELKKEEEHDITLYRKRLEAGEINTSDMEKSENAEDKDVYDIASPGTKHANEVGSRENNNDQVKEGVEFEKRDDVKKDIVGDWNALNEMTEVRHSRSPDTRSEYVSHEDIPKSEHVLDIHKWKETHDDVAPEHPSQTMGMYPEGEVPRTDEVVYHTESEDDDNAEQRIDTDNWDHYGPGEGFNASESTGTQSVSSVRVIAAGIVLGAIAAAGASMFLVETAIVYNSQDDGDYSSTAQELRIGDVFRFFKGD